MKQSVITLLKQSILPAVVFLLTSCEVFQGTPVFNKPNPKDWVGSYAVTKVSLSVANRRELKNVALVVSADGSFQRGGYSSGPSGPLIPGDRGTWDLDLTSGADITSGRSWALRFVSTDGTYAFGLCLHDARQPGSLRRLFFLDSPHNRIFDDFLIMEKTR